ncbi:MAG: peptidylprolyl isomerase [Alphaproteobacteria bacterium]|nr:peptidylprolyl isomerase [Alphaproteobacteria bacterium]
MQISAPGITVNGILISPDEINAEVQYHPADNLYGAKYEAMKALVIREILIQRAAELGLCTRDKAIKKPDEVIDSLLEKEISVPEADKKTCLHYYNSNKKRFFTSPLFEVSHILYLAPPDDEKAKKKALKQAQTALKRIKDDPALFEAIAREESACSSASDGGRLGQISKGQTMPAFETALFQMNENETSNQPVATEVGYHIIRVHKKAEGTQLPFDAVHDWIRNDLRQKSWNRAFNQYIQLLAGKSEISGFRLESSKTPLVQ